MERCGDYTTDRAIGWGRTATYYTGFAGEKGEARVVIRCSRSTDPRHLQVCLFSSAEQQTATSTGCRRVAPILDFGIAESGRAYQITVGYESSLAECIRAGNAVDGESLKAIVTGTLHALTELRDKCRRAHGNLTAGNILLDKDGGVVVTDLAPSARDASHADDLRALGTIIYQLVQRSLSVGFLAPPLDRSPKWAESLEEKGDDWREFTNRMLSSKRQEEGELLKRAWRDLKALDSLATQAAPMPPPPVSHGVPGSRVVAPPVETRPRKRRGRKAITALLVTGLCATGGVVVWKQTRPPPPPVVLTTQTLAAGMAGLKKLMPPPAKKRSEGENYIIRRLSSAGTVSEMESLLRFEWNTATQLKKISHTWRTSPRNWETLAGALTTNALLEPEGEELTDSARLERMEAAVKDLDRTGEMLASAEAVEQRWEKIKSLCQRLVALGIRDLPDFTNWASAEIGTSEKLEAARQKAVGAEAVLVTLLASAEKNKALLRPETFKKSTQSIADFSRRVDASSWPKLWQTAIESSLRPADNVLKEWNDAFARLESRITARPSAEREAWRQKLGAIRASVAIALASDQDDITKEIAKLQNDIRNPVEDLDEAYRKLVAGFSAQLGRAATTAEARTALADFKSASTKLVNDPQFADSRQAFFTHYGYVSLAALYQSLDGAANSPESPTFNFAGPAAAKWKPQPGIAPTANSATFYFQPDPSNNRNRSDDITFHILPAGKTAAMASVETSLALARLSGVPLEPPLDGPLGYRDRPNTPDRWLWPGAEAWAQKLLAKGGAKPFNALFPHNTDIERCPLTWVSRGRSEAIATALGGRLPSAGEWNAARQAFPQATARLRGTVFAEATAEMRNLFSGSGPLAPLPIALNSFTYRPGPADFAGAVNDQRLMWLAAVNNDPARIVDLIGNASEWVVADGKQYIVGGSCLTPRETQFTTPVELPSDRPYCDVSFRLVVPVTMGSGNAGLDALKAAAAKESELLDTKGAIKIQPGASF